MTLFMFFFVNSLPCCSEPLLFYYYLILTLLSHMMHSYYLTFFRSISVAYYMMCTNCVRTFTAQSQLSGYLKKGGKEEGWERCQDFVDPQHNPVLLLVVAPR